MELRDNSYYKAYVLQSTLSGEIKDILCRILDSSSINTLSKKDVKLLEKATKGLLNDLDKSIVFSALAWYYRLVEKDVYKSLECFKKVTHEAFRLEAYVNIAECYSLLNMVDEALRYFEMALGCAGKSDKGKILESIRKIKSSPLMEKILADEVMKIISTSGGDKRKLRRALEKCDEILSVNPNSKTAHYLKGIIYGKGNLGDPVRAQQEFNLAK